MASKDRTHLIPGIAKTCLQNKHYVTCIDIFLGLGMLTPAAFENWRRRREPCLENCIQGNLAKISRYMNFFHSWAVKEGLKPSWTAYVAKTRAREPLRFSVSGRDEIERRYATHYVSPELSEKKRQRLQEKSEKPPELVVYEVITDRQCNKCQASLPKGAFILLDGDALCMECAGLGHFDFLPAGDAGVTRRARLFSSVSYPVVRFSRARKRYERQGILVEAEALAKALAKNNEETRVSSDERVKK